MKLGRLGTFGIAFKLGLLLATVSVLASGLTGFYAYQASRNLLVQSAKADLLTATNAVVRRITLNREEISRNLQVLAREPAAISTLQNSNAADDDQVANLFERQMDINPSYFQIRLISTSNSGMERVRVDRADAGLVHVKDDDLQEKGHFPYVSGALKLQAGSTYLSRIVINHETGAHAGLNQPAVVLSTPVMDKTGRAIGVVVVNVDLNGMFKSLASDLPADYLLYLANRDGDLLIHPDSTQTFGFDRGRRVMVQSEFTATQVLFSGSQNQVLTEVSDGRYAQAPVVAAFVGRGVKALGDEDRLVLGLAVPLANVLQQANSLGWVVLQLVAGLCLACILLAIVVARAVTRPVNMVSAAVQRFANGEPVDKLLVNRKDELGVLALSFNHMQDKLNQQMTALEQSRQEMDELARHDALTGLPNRRLFQERLDNALARSQRSGKRFALLFIDVDKFKSINDRWGHDAGDEVLKVIAKRLVSNTRKADAVARIGGDEFVVLLDSPANQEDIVAIAEKLLESVRCPIQHNGTELQVGFSIGISQFPDNGTTATELMTSADHAMYEAKSAGRDGFKFSASAVKPK